MVVKKLFSRQSVKSVAKAVKNAVFNPLQTISIAVLSSAIDKIVKDFKKNNPSFDYKNRLNLIVKKTNTVISEFNKSKNEAKIVEDLKKIEKDCETFVSDISDKLKLTNDKHRQVFKCLALILFVKFKSILKKHPDIA